MKEVLLFLTLLACVSLINSAANAVEEAAASLKTQSAIPRLAAPQ